ncbi:MAG: HypC/HybG/HupF family hydrogenase formation chaperone [Methanomassiliicoccales archaeon]|jgi:hydrogenase expression/formation protein HypC|nr:HypC/HybG/HupF family hydrogenase formation chaperone [Methanomassiliicoccales archaeon]MDD1756296.1 HypC/HybG/HupF family hydrogenase formation chaperone [Methanomassiliicoccales archaeon]
MCLAVPGKIVSINGQNALIDFGGVQREANVSLIEPIVGDYVVVHAGFAIQVVDEEEAKETIKLWEELMASQQQEG